jgi:hypothetical protein
MKLNCLYFGSYEELGVMYLKLTLHNDEPFRSVFFLSRGRILQKINLELTHKISRTVNTEEKGGVSVLPLTTTTTSLSKIFFERTCRS